MSDKKPSINKAILGIVIGAAVGSVIGASVAPDKGVNTRKKLKRGLVSVLKKIIPKEKQKKRHLDEGEI